MGVRLIVKALVVTLLCAPAACVSTGAVTEVKAPAAALPYNAVAVTVIAEGEHQERGQKLAEIMNEALADAELFAAVADGGLTIEAEIVGFKGGEGFARAMSMGGEAEVTLRCRLKDADGQVLGELEITGNSARKSETTIGGFNTKWTDDLEARALAAASEQLIEYLEKHKEAHGG